MLSFIVEEIPQQGSSLATTPERFEWTAAAMNAPTKPHKYPGKLRYKRTDYDGSEAPTFQVVGAVLTPIQFEGTWNDRYNTVDYAKQTRRRFIAMCYRGNPVRVSFDDQVLEGLITDWDCPYVDDYRIKYSFTLDPGADDMIGQARVQRGQDTVPGSLQNAEDVRTQVMSLSDASTTAPTSVLAGTLPADHAADVQGVSDSMDEIDRVNSQVLISQAESPTALQRAASAYSGINNSAVGVLETLLTVRADTGLQYRSALGELQFDEWRTTVSFYARTTMGVARTSEQASQERAAPKAQVTYRPHKGENLYAVSLAVYGTPDNARLIADRNNLPDYTLQGTETLVIPEPPAS